MKVHETAGLISISVSKEFQGGEAFEKGLLRDSVGEILFSLHLPTDVIFFKGELRKGDSTYFNARIKDALYKVQRREALRLPVPGARTVLIEPSIGVGYSAELQNISEGGIGVVFRNKEEFESASALKSPITLTFTAFGLAIVVQAAVRHGAEVSSTMTKKTYRLGFSFVGIEPKLLVQISQLVFEESAKYLGRF